MLQKQKVKDKRLADFFGDTIFTYTQKQAIDDGMLVDITTWAETKEVGFTVPVVITNHLYEFLQVPKGLEGFQDFKGRLWDTVFLASIELRKYITRLGDKPKPEREIIPFEVLYKQEYDAPPKPFKLWLIFESWAGFTIMFPEDY